MAVLATVPVLVYADSLRNSFTYDDFPFILNNPAVTNPSFLRIFQATRGSNVFRPLTFATFVLNWLLGTIHAWGYHLVNVLLHAAVTLLLYLLLRKLLANVPRVETLAFVAALIFAVHPIHSEAVASISCRSELLAAGFLFAAWLFHLRDRPPLALLCFACALFSKESAVAFVPLALAGDYLCGKLRPISRYIWIIAVAIVYVGVLWLGQGGRFGEFHIHVVDNPLVALSFVWRVLNALRVAWKYVVLQLYPATLSAEYSYNAIATYTDWPHVLPAAFATLVVLILWVWTMWNRYTAWALAGAIYLAGFSVTANILIPTGTIMGERLAYLPSAGFCLLMALVWTKLINWRPTLGWGLLTVLLFILGVRSFVRNADWRSDYTLFSATVRTVPGSARAHSNIAGQYLAQGKIDLAAAELQTSLNIYPDLPDAVESYGLIQSRLGNDQDARRLLERAVVVTRPESIAREYRLVNFAAFLIKVGDNDRALSLLDEAIKAEPGDARAWSNRAVVRYRRGELAAARTDAESALRLDPANIQAQSLLHALNERSAAAPSR